VIDAVQGLGEALVSGEVTPDHYELDVCNVLLRQELAGESAVLSPAELTRLARQARQTAAVFSQPVDMEWAIDHTGQLFWLQVRPITTLPADLNEFDEVVRETDIFTTGNIGEMMPGAVCPLTTSVTLRGIEYGFQHLDIILGAQKTFTERYTQVCSFYGHWFFNLTGKVAGGSYVAGMSAKEAGFSICGQDVPELVEPARKAWWLRVRGAWRFYRYLRKAEHAVNAFSVRLGKEFSLRYLPEPAAMMHQINELVLWVLAAEDVHVCSSASSAVTGGILQGVIAQGQPLTQQHMGELARLMAGASGVESAELVQELDVLVAAIMACDDAAYFTHDDLPLALQWLTENSSLAVKKHWQDFLERHGHRAYRELCVREKGWAEDPLPLIRTLQTNVKAKLAMPTMNTPVADLTEKKTSAESPIGINSRFVRWWLPFVHNGVRRRERTKSQLVFVTREIGKAYRHLGALLAKQGVFPDEDLVYFFTHEELVHCAGVPSSSQVAQALQRKAALAYQQRLRIPFLCQGKPSPELPVTVVVGNVLTGRPVSCGTVEGVCRVAFSPEEAVQLQAGEILIAPVTDIAWTPYFSLIAGLATDIGSSVSHGAVIAREYGLPAVVNLRCATQRFKTGDRVRLNGSEGTLTLLE
jgi:pyruvate,water dikinase